MYQQPPAGSGWGGVQHAHQRITELEEKFSSMKVDIATIKEGMLTEEKMRTLLDWGPGREERTWRGWQNANYQQMQQMPAQALQQRSLGYQAEQTHIYRQQTLAAWVVPVVCVLLSVVVGLLLKMY